MLTPTDKETLPPRPADESPLSSDTIPLVEVLDPLPTDTVPLTPAAEDADPTRTRPLLVPLPLTMFMSPPSVVAEPAETDTDPPLQSLQ